MRIAAVSDDGKTISAHFGRAAQYVVVEVEGGEIKSQEIRDKPGHHTFHKEGEGHHHDHDHDHDHRQGHGMGAGAQQRHRAMTEVIQDCEVILSRGMGRGAYMHMQQAGIKPVITDISDVLEAVQAYLDGTLVDHTERLH
jgi:predicted Fe-Mo cluster-binding NifX family protein